MIGRRRTEVHDAPDDLDAVWATDEIPIDDGPTEFDWSSTNREPEPAGDEPPPNRRGTIIGVGVAAALLLVVGAIVVWPNSDDPADETDDSNDAPPATLSTLPESQVTTIPDIEVDSTVAQPEDAVFEVSGPEGNALEESVDDDQRPSLIELPPELASVTAPSEIVVATGDGLVTLSLPSGQLRYADDVPLRFGGGSMVVAPDATALIDGNDLLISQRDGTVTEVENVGGSGGGGFLQGWSIGTDGTTQFMLFSYGTQGDGEALLIDVNGGVTTVFGNGSDLAYDFIRSSGGRIVNDTGGVYELGDDGTATRVSTGRAFAANAGYIVVRECDDDRSCALAVLDTTTDERRLINSDLVELDNLFGLDLSPDGTALAVERASGTDVAGNATVIIDLDGGVVGEIPSPGFFTTGSTWTADGAGIISRRLGGDGLVFLDRRTGAVVEFGDGIFNNIIDLGLRYPDAELPPEPTDPVARAITLSGPVTVPTGLDLVVLGQGDRMAYVDIDGRTATPWSVPAIGGGSPEIFVNGTIVTVAAATKGFTSVFGNATEIATDETPLPPAPRLVGPLAGLVWAPAEEAGTGVDHRLVVLGQLPALEGPEFTVENSTLLGSDGAGGLLAAVGGDLFSVSAEGSSRLTSGELLALNATTALERVCLDDLTCTVNLVDRTSGLQNSLNEPALVDLVPVGPERSVPVAGTISPDNTAFVVQFLDDPSFPPWALVDLRSQSIDPLPPPDPLQPLIWNELSTYLAYVSDGNVYVYDRASGGVSLVQGLGTVRAIAAVGPEFAEFAETAG